MSFRTLMAHTAFSGKNLNLDLLDVLASDTPEQKEALARILGADAKRWREVQTGESPLVLAELVSALQGLKAAGFNPAPEKIKEETSPFRQQAFYDFLCSSEDAVKALQENIQRLNDESKQESGFVKAIFNIFSHQNPAEKATADVIAFERYCRKNRITFDEVRQQLVAGERPKTYWDKIKDMRFLIAAFGGAALGLAGVNLAAVPVLAVAPAVFFGVLPWLAAPFIGLNIFKSFSEYSMIKESPTLLRFAAITAAGLAISLGVTMAMTTLLPPVDPATIQAMTGQGAAAGGFNPMQYILPTIAAFSGAALAYKRAKSTVAGEFNDGGTGNKLTQFYNKAVNTVMNKHTAPLVVAAGKMGEKATAFINKAFPAFIDVTGVPVVTVLMSATMATGGLGLLGMFAGYYVTAFTGLFVGGAAMMAAFYAMGCRGKDFSEIASAAMTGFSLSSSSATMPKEKECLQKIGVSAKTRNTVVPLGGVFNMYGTSLYMGLTAFYAMTMFNATPSLMNYMMTAGSVMAIALGAPGIPASNITMLEPVLRQTGLASGQIHKVYAMVLPADRILDMTQTALNVMGDMIAAVHPDRHRLRYQRVKNIRQIREKKAAALKLN